MLNIFLKVLDDLEKESKQLERGFLEEIVATIEDEDKLEGILKIQKNKRLSRY